MANRETPFQTELVQAFKSSELPKFHVFKAAHRDKVGVVDLYVRGEEDALWVECKWLSVDPTMRTKKVSMTRPQWAFLRDEREAGGAVAKWVGYKIQSAGGRDTQGVLLCDPRSIDTQVLRSYIDDPTHAANIRKPWGQPWPVKLMYRRSILMLNGGLPYITGGRGT